MSVLVFVSHDFELGRTWLAGGVYCNYPAPGRGKTVRGIVFGRFLSLFQCQQDYEKTAGPICMKFSGKVSSDHGTT